MIRWSRVLVITTKELRDTLRDRRTLIMMILVPLLLYPLGGIAITQLTASTMARIDREGYDVALEGPADEIRTALDADRSLRPHRVPDARAALTRPGAPAAIALRLKKQLVPAPRAGTETFDQLEVEVLFDSTSPRSRAALSRLRKVLEQEARAREQTRLGVLGLSMAHIRPMLLSESSVASEQRTVLSHLGPAIGILLILLSLIGAFYPAIDLIAGERERGTLEPLLATPTSRLEILAGKYGCLVVLSLAACALNLLALGLTTAFMLGKVVGPRLSLGYGLTGVLFVATLPVLLLVSALLLLSAIFARSFKDAQNLMTPVYLLCLLPAMGALVPEVHLNTATAWVPILGSVLVIKDALSGGLQLAPVLVALACGVCYALLGVALAAYVFDRPEILGARASDHALSGFISERDPGGGRVPTLSGALALYCICLALLLHLGTRLQMVNLRWGLVLTEIGLLLLPVLALLRLGRVPIRTGLGLRRMGACQLLGAALCGAGAVGVSLLLFNLVIGPLLRPPPEYYQALDALRPKKWVDIIPIIAIAAVLPALCEEALCRGLVLGAARRVLGAPLAVLLSGFLFAALHIDPYRFASTFLLGSLLAVLALRSGSVITSMAAHLVNNAAAILIAGALGDGHRDLSAATAIALSAVSAAALLFGLLLARREPTADA